MDSSLSLRRWFWGLGCCALLACSSPAGQDKTDAQLDNLPADSMQELSPGDVSADTVDLLGDGLEVESDQSDVVVPLDADIADLELIEPLCPGDEACDDGDPCTLDRCEPLQGCLHSWQNSPCEEDGNPCTADQCVNGVCMHLPGNNGAVCDDEDDCTGEGMCQGGLCLPGVTRPECLGTCGDGQCLLDETAANCPVDCGPCGDGICGLHEAGFGGGSCPGDCLAKCGDGLCQGGENPVDCIWDCGGCGDGFCGLQESHTACAPDCPASCGDGLCEMFEGPGTCPADCLPECGNAVCEGGENPYQCPLDCAFCGDGVCGLTEAAVSCAMDCAPACGDGVCQHSEDGEACPIDCGACGDAVCGYGEFWVSCPVDCFVSCGNGVCEANLGEGLSTCPFDCVEDVDGDGVLDGVDNCPLVSNADQLDQDGDEAGDACDPDVDGDGESNVTDCAVFDPEISHFHRESCDDVDRDCNGDPYADADCDDGNPCTLDTCNPEAGCFHDSLSDVPCDDDNACTTAGTCWNGLCVVQPVVCDDGNPCSVDLCNPVLGCHVIPGNDGEPCEDSDSCTLETTCLDGLCVAGALGPGCGGCSQTGCPANPDPCSGKLKCNLATELCVVIPGSAVKCSMSSNPCIEAVCNHNTGNCDAIATPNGVPCDDLNACTFGETCEWGLCKGDSYSCDDGNSCTQDSCGEEPYACHFEPIAGIPCEDGDFCTVQGLCDSEGKCVGHPRNCGDGDLCTQDSCDSQVGCLNPPLECPPQQVCVAGECICQPDCLSRECGADGCGGDCGVCPAGSLCDENGQCRTSCDSECDGRACGFNRCGGSCGDCQDGDTCTTFGECVPQCIPNCDGRECGSDGCGTPCGSCGGISPYCDDGLCVAQCVPHCDGRACGDDGCGGLCGTCSEGTLCTLSGTCGNPCTQGALTASCYHPGFMAGGLEDWALNAAMPASNLGALWPPNGETLLVLDSSQVDDQGLSEARFQNRLPHGTYQVLLRWMLVSNAIPTLCSQALQDVLEVSVRSGDSTLFLRQIHLRDLCQPSQCAYCGLFYEGLDSADDILGAGFVATHWREDWFPFSLSSDTQELTFSLVLTAVSTGTVRTVALVDAVSFIPCASSCDFLECGTSPCGMNCGECDTGTCIGGTCCAADCEGKVCGNDGCGGSCGDCPDGQLCVGNTCHPCLPDCLLNRCGDDGCGGSCGTCDEHQVCQIGSCVDVPWCGDGLCGLDEDCLSCAEDCGVCCGDGLCEAALNEDCDTCPADCGCDCGWVCLAGSCQYIACYGLECGDDGCGGSCGTCPEHHDCVDGVCQVVAWCGDGWCDPGVEDCALCPADCPCGCGESCLSGVCQFDACTGKQCGPDGCGGSCGTCAANAICLENQTCLCLPSCTGRTCGDDGCGGSCGVCAGAKVCVDGNCQ